MDAAEEDLSHRFHIIKQHLLEGSLIRRGLFVNLLRIIPHLKNYHLIYVPILALIFELIEALWLFLLVFGYPIFAGYKEEMKMKKDNKLTLALLCQKITLDRCIGIFDMFNLLCNGDLMLSRK